MNLVNSALVGRIGTAEIAGVGCGSMVMTFCTFPFQFLLYVTTPAVARAVSKNDKDEASKGHKDTRTPLIASLVANVANATMVATFIFKFRWGVSGAALATTGSQYICAGIMFYLLVRNKILQLRHLAIPPALADWTPMLKAGAALAIRSVISICVPLFATSRVGTYGTVALATNELMRQLYIGSLTLLAGFDISAQALVASYLGQGDAEEARAVSARIMQIAVASATVLGAVILLNRFNIPKLFSRDAAVILLAGKLMPILACTIPFDAMASILDGTLLGASETSYISAATIINSLMVLFALTRLTVLYPGLATVWLTTKLMTLGRIITGAWRLISKGSRFDQIAAEVQLDLKQKSA
ncbi:hypothetical protein WJX73_004686 [Symbiochloris irregularis]|uniref:Uncharacterized protein n=1 Tax=Symbiochloris irregularis TaxID=706552 RepID=A0AAW1NXJ6_9CHLO